MLEFRVIAIFESYKWFTDYVNQEMLKVTLQCNVMLPIRRKASFHFIHII